MYTIRKNVFETNSSSMHSVTYTPNKSDMIDFAKLRQDFAGKEDITVSFGEFGWGYDVLSSFSEKLEYVLTTIQYYDNQVDCDRPETIVNSKYYKVLDEMLRDTIGIGLKIDEDSHGGYYKMGYVDHQSTDTLDDYFNNNEDDFRNEILKLLFDDNYRIIIDNDNH